MLPINKIKKYHAIGLPGGKNLEPVCMRCGHHFTGWGAKVRGHIMDMKCTLKELIHPSKRLQNWRKRHREV